MYTLLILSQVARSGKITAMNTTAYPRNWKEQSFQCKKSARWTCQHCGVHQNTIRYSRRTGAEYHVHLHAAHLDHDKYNPTPRLACLCEKCHGRYDWLCRIKRQDTRIEKMKHAMLIKMHKASKKIA